MIFPLSLPADFRIRITQRRQVGRARLRVQIGQQAVVTTAALQLCDAALRVVRIAEDDGLRRAHGLTGGDDLAVTYRSALFFGFDLRHLNALYAVGAFLHHTARAHGHFRVTHQLIGWRVEILVEQEVEAPHLVRTVVRAVARPNATVVDHHVQAFRIVHGRVDGTDRLAGRVLAVHTGDGHELRGLRVVVVAFEVGVNANPVHLAAALDLLLADDGDIVLRLAGDNAGVTADATGRVDRHPPGRFLTVIVLWIKGILLARLVLFIRRVLGLGLFQIIFQSVLAYDFAILHAEMQLRGGERIVRAGITDARARVGPRRIGGANGVGVKALAVADAARATPAVAEMHGDDAVGLARQNPDGNAGERAALVCQVSGAYKHVAALDADVVLETEAIGRRRAQHQRVVPGDLARGLRQFLKPAIVSEASVVDGRVCPKDYLKLVRLRGRSRRGGLVGPIRFEGGCGRCACRRRGLSDGGGCAGRRRVGRLTAGRCRTRSSRVARGCCSGGRPPGRLCGTLLSGGLRSCA